MISVLRYLLIAVMAWLPVGQVVASCCAWQMGEPQMVHEAATELPCDGHMAQASEQQAQSEVAEVCQCGCSLSGHASITLDLLPAHNGHPAMPAFPAAVHELLPAHAFPLLRPPTQLS